MTTVPSWLILDASAIETVSGEEVIREALAKVPDRRADARGEASSHGVAATVGSR